MHIFEKHPIIFQKPKMLAHSSWETHVPFAFFLVSILQPKMIVELGVFSGQSYCAFCQAVKYLKLNTQCFGIDTWKGDSMIGSYSEAVFEKINKYNQLLYSDFSQLLRMPFNEALNQFRDESIDLLHIDGSHTYQDVKNDFESWLPKMSKRGVILFHDTFIKDQEFGVWKLWEEISPKYPSFEFHHGCGLGVLVVGKEVNLEFVQFVKEANSSRIIQKIFNSLGELVLSQRIIKDSKKTLSDLGSTKIAILRKIIKFIIPRRSLRRKILNYTKTLITQFQKNIPEPYLETFKSLNSMPFPQSKHKKKCAIFVMVKNEEIFLPIWLKYYSRYFDAADIYVFDHNSTDGSIQKCLKEFSFNVIPLRYPLSFDHDWFKFVASNAQKKLLKHYEYVIFTDVDEIILPNPQTHKGLDDYLLKLKKPYVRCVGYELIHVSSKENPFDSSKSILSQRKFWSFSELYNKTLISKQPIHWTSGFHDVHYLNLKVEEDLLLIHLHRLDFETCRKKTFERARLWWCYKDIANNDGWQNRLIDPDEFNCYYEGFPDELKITEIPDEIRSCNLF